MSFQKINILFICSKNQWRSPTAERVYASHPLVHARSAGTASSARHQVTAVDIQWADMLILMEDKHRSRLRADFPGEMKYKQCHVLHIPDEYKYMDPELVAEIKLSVDPLITI